MPPRPPAAAAAGLDASFAALADATRRAVIAGLLERPQRAGDLARALSLSPPALSRHLRILRRAGLAREEGDAADARVPVYRVHEAGFLPVRDWVAEVEDYWSAQHAGFKAHAERARGRTSR